MSKLFGRAAVPVVLAVLAVPAWSGLSAQQQGPEPEPEAHQNPFLGLPEIDLGRDDAAGEHQSQDQ